MLVTPADVSVSFVPRSGAPFTERALAEHLPRAPVSLVPETRGRIHQPNPGPGSSFLPEGNHMQEGCGHSPALRLGKGGPG